MKKSIPILFALLGLADAGYLTYEHYAKLIIPCSAGLIVDCGKVLESQYATVYGIPLALIGVFHYSILLIAAILAWRTRSIWATRGLFLISAVGFVASLYFVYLQLFVIGAICLYCMVSALNSLCVYLAVRFLYEGDFRRWIVWLSGIVYTRIVKPILFLINPEIVHTIMTRSGEFLGTLPGVRHGIAWVFTKKYPLLQQDRWGIPFHSPIGLSAGFDYEARLTQILPSLGFGFQSIGTITNLAYEGNPKPMLGRLPKSRSLMVNKGFKNDGAALVIKKLRRLRFHIPVGISIGKTNTTEINTQKAAVADIINAFQQFESSHLKIGYYELNISCPNLKGNISFYPPNYLEELLLATDSLKLKKPVFIKMPIEKSDAEFIAMMDVIVKHNVQAIIVGNLQKDRKDPALDPREVKQWSVGNFSGKPTQRRSNELISLAYKKYGKKIDVIGCGGVFSSADAYEKIKRGACLVQLITGMIYQGPHLIAQINMELHDLLKEDGYLNITQAIGTYSD